jgi:regulatory protein
MVQQHSREQTRRAPRPLDSAGLRSLALFYVGRYATTRAKLSQYLKRKLRERGWEEEESPDVAALVEQLAALSYVDDDAFAQARAGALQRRGFGPGRVRASLEQAGIDRDTSVKLASLTPEDALAAAVSLARRRRFGRFGTANDDPKLRQRQMAALIRAGHGFDAARAALDHVEDGE